MWGPTNYTDTSYICTYAFILKEVQLGMGIVGRIKKLDLTILSPDKVSFQICIEMWYQIYNTTTAITDAVEPFHSVTSKIKETHSNNLDSDNYFLNATQWLSAQRNV